ncbi:MAG TPA: hypothetical protein VL549_11745 [Gemmatimonadales bacterium]|nr:hypothetical protein [Gemmatimonadales bacterium]
MHRFIPALLFAYGAVTSLLAAQDKGIRSNAVAFGYVATLGDGWEIESVEIGFARRPRHGFAALMVGARMGAFVNEKTMLGGTGGAVVAATLSARTKMNPIAEFGTDEHGTGLGLDVTFELSGYAATRSPLAQGTHWAAVSVLPAISIGNGDAAHFALVIGPTLWLSGTKPAMRGMFALRGEAPLARRERRP